MASCGAVRAHGSFCRSGEIGRRRGLKILRALRPCRFDSDLRHHKILPYKRTLPFQAIGLAEWPGLDA